MNQLCDIKTDVENLSATKKAVEEIQHPSNTLSLRERQLLIMFISDDNFCKSNPNSHDTYCDLCNALVSKVDLGSLVERGYLKLKPGATLLTATASKPTQQQCKPIRKTIKNVAERHQANRDEVATQVDVDEVEPEVFLRVASGNF